MKKYISFLSLLFIFFAFFCFAAEVGKIGGKDVGDIGNITTKPYEDVGKVGGVDGGTATNYTLDASCAGVYYMNGDSGNESNRCNGATDVMTQTSGTIPRVSGAGNVPTGYSGYSRDFDAADTEYLECAEATCTALDINGADAKVTLMAWIKNEAIADTADQMIISKWGGAGVRQYVLLIVGTGVNTFKVSFSKSNDGTALQTTVGSTTTLASGAWYHIAAVYDDTDLRVYVNGVLDCTAGASCTASTNGIYNAAGSIVLGTYLAGSSYGPFDGLIDEVGIFSRALSSTEVLAIYTNGLSGDKGGGD